MTRAALKVSEREIADTEAVREFSLIKNAGDVSISCYEKDIPAFVADEMRNLYENIFSSLEKFKALGEMNGACAYVLRRGDMVSSAFLFLKEGKRVHVLNEFIRIDDEELKQFTRYIFERYDDVTIISFRAIQPGITAFPYPHQRHNCIEDIVLTLPDSVQEYQTRLGKNMRKNVKTYLERIKRKYPSFSYAVYDTPDVDEDHIRSIIRFNRERTVSKNKAVGIDKDEIEKTIELVKSCGMVAAVTIDGEICAGKLFFKVGDNYFSLLNAHSPEFNEYRLGTLCNYLSICECIARGGKEYHFLWGREEFKYRFLGEQRDYDEMVIYRSSLGMLMNGRIALNTALMGRARQIRLWMLDPKRKDSRALIFAKRALRYFRGRTPPQDKQEG